MKMHSKMSLAKWRPFCLQRGMSQYHGRRQCVDSYVSNIIKFLNVFTEHNNCEYLARPTLERRKTLGHLRSINHNMIIHFANQSQTCQLLKILTSSLCCIFPSHFLFFFKIPVRCIIPAHFHSFFVTFSFSIPVHWIFPSHLHFHSVALFIFPEFWKWSGAPFLFCIVLLPHFLALYRPFITPITGWPQLYIVTICIFFIVPVS